MPTLASYRLDELLTAIAAKSPTPGGGAVAGAVGAIASALAGMVVSYSVGKKNLAQHEPFLQDAQRRLEACASLMLKLADEDAEAYGQVNELSKLPETDPRRAFLPAATEASVQVPMSALAACSDLLRLMKTLATTTNRHLRSDLAIAAVLAEAAARSCRWNILVNVPGLADPGARESHLSLAQELVERCRSLATEVEQACEG